MTDASAEQEMNVCNGVRETVNIRSVDDLDEIAREKKELMGLVDHFDQNANFKVNKNGNWTREDKSDDFLLNSIV